MWKGNLLVKATIGIALTALTLLSLYLNSQVYTVTYTPHDVQISTYGHTFHIKPTSTDDLVVYLDTFRRYTIDQYLVQDNGPLRNISDLLTHILHSDISANVTYYQPVNTTRRYFHFGPYKGAFHVHTSLTGYRVEINIPESAIEFNNEDLRLTPRIKISPPWALFITLPLIMGFSLSLLACLLFISLPAIKGKKKGTSSQPAGNGFLSLSPLLAFSLGFGIIACVLFFVYHAMPGFGDEMNYLLQAKIFASGHLFIPTPPFKDFFAVSWMDMFGIDNKVWGFHGIGNSIILMIGWLVGIPWITIPIVGGLILTVQYFIAIKLFKNVYVAWLHICLMITSHYFLALTGSYMAHAPSMLFISVFFLFVIMVIQEDNDLYLFPAFACIGFAYDIRPASAVLSAVIPGCALLYHWYRRRNVHVGYLGIAILTGAAIASLSYFYTYFINGTFNLAYLVRGPETGRTLAVRWAEGWTYRLENLYQNMSDFQNRVHSGTYFFNYLFFFMPIIFWKTEKRKLLMIAGYLTFILYMVLHSFLHFYGWKWEPRMIYDISFIFFLLSTYGIVVLYNAARTREGGTALLILGGLVYAIFLFRFDLPFRYSVEYNNYSVSPPDIRNLIIKRNIHNAIILFKNEDIYAPYSPYNDLSFNGDIIYAVSQNSRINKLFIAAHPGRKVYYAEESTTLEPYEDTENSY